MKILQVRFLKLWGVERPTILKILPVKSDGTIHNMFFILQVFNELF